MAVVLFDGFDFYTQSTFNGFGIPLSSRWTVVSIPSTGVGYTTGGRYGSGRCIRVPSVTGTAMNARINLGANYTTVAFGFAVRLDNAALWGAAGSGQSCWIFNDSALLNQLQFNIDGNGNWVVWRGGTTNLGTSSGRPLLTATWHYVEAEIVISDTVGSVKMWVDDTQVMNLTGIDTCATANVNVASLTLYISTASSSAQQFDDLYVTDGTRLGEQVVIPLRPNADTAQKDFTPNSGATNYTQVDDTSTDNDTTYVSSSTLGARDYYDLENLPSYAVTPKGVNTFISARKVDAGARYLRVNLKSSSSLASSSDLILATGYDTRIMTTWTDPNGGGAWTTTAINALQVGPEITL